MMITFATRRSSSHAVVPCARRRLGARRPILHATTLRTGRRMFRCRRQHGSPLQWHSEGHGCDRHLGRAPRAAPSTGRRRAAPISLYVDLDPSVADAAASSDTRTRVNSLARRGARHALGDERELPRGAEALQAATSSGSRATSTRSSSATGRAGSRSSAPALDGIWIDAPLPDSVRATGSASSRRLLRSRRSLRSSAAATARSSSSSAASAGASTGCAAEACARSPTSARSSPAATTRAAGRSRASSGTSTSSRPSTCARSRRSSTGGVRGAGGTPTWWSSRPRRAGPSSRATCRTKCRRRWPAGPQAEAHPRPPELLDAVEPRARERAREQRREAERRALAREAAAKGRAVGGLGGDARSRVRRPRRDCCSSQRASSGRRWQCPACGRLGAEGGRVPARRDARWSERDATALDLAVAPDARPRRRVSGSCCSTTTSSPVEGIGALLRF